MGPAGHLHLLPLAESVETELQQPRRLLFPRGNEPDNVLVKALGDEFLLYVSDEAFLVLPGGEFLYDLFVICHGSAKIVISPESAPKKPGGKPSGP